MPARVAGEIDLLADLDRFDLDPGAGALEDVEGRGHDLRADPVAVRDRDGDLGAHAVLSGETGILWEGSRSPLM